MPSLNFVAAANTIGHAGATPVFCDITSTDDLTVSPEDLQAATRNLRSRSVEFRHRGFEQWARHGRSQRWQVVQSVCGSTASRRRSWAALSGPDSGLCQAMFATSASGLSRESGERWQSKQNFMVNGSTA